MTLSSVSSTPLPFNKSLAYSKSDLFSKDEMDTASVAKTLAHPARIKILKILMETNACMCGEIVDLMPLAQATVSQHLKELKNAKLIKGTIEGPKICYCLDNEQLKRTKLLFDSLFNHICNC